MNTQERRERRYKRHRRIRAKIFGTAARPRLVIFRSRTHLYAQLVDDETGRTIASMSDGAIKAKSKKQKIEISKEIGRALAQKAIAQNIQKVVFDRGGYAYHGHVKAVAEGAREGGLQF